MVSRIASLSGPHWSVDWTNAPSPPRTPRGSFAQSGGDNRWRQGAKASHRLQQANVPDDAAPGHILEASAAVAAPVSAPSAGIPGLIVGAVEEMQSVPVQQAVVSQAVLEEALRPDAALDSKVAW